jgi:hypothetical protein
MQPQVQTTQTLKFKTLTTDVLQNILPCENKNSLHATPHVPRSRTTYRIAKKVVIVNIDTSLTKRGN